MLDAIQNERESVERGFERWRGTEFSKSPLQECKRLKSVRAMGGDLKNDNNV